TLPEISAENSSNVEDRSNVEGSSNLESPSNVNPSNVEDPSNVNDPSNVEDPSKVKDPSNVEDTSNVRGPSNVENPSNIDPLTIEDDPMDLCINIPNLYHLLDLCKDMGSNGFDSYEKENRKAIDDHEKVKKSIIATETDSLKKM
ncbi:14172_t:CDS:2, partial [Racocetra fulgida]